VKWLEKKDSSSQGYSIYKVFSISVDGGGSLTLKLLTESSHFNPDNPTKEQMIKACNDMIKELSKV